MAETVKIKDTSSSGLLWLAGIGAGLYLLFNKIIKPSIIAPIQLRNAVERIQITYPRARIQLDKRRILISFVVNNPNNAPILISSIVAQVWAGQANKVHIADVDYYNKTTILPNNKTDITLIAELKVMNTISYVMELAKGGLKGHELLLRGTINANGNPWPIEELLNLA